MGPCTITSYCRKANDILMPCLPVTVSGFASGPTNGDSRLDISKRRFLKFAVSTGSPIFAATIGGPRLPVAFAAYKALAAKTSLDFTTTEFTLVDGYENLEPTEKANLSYWVGMTVAAIVADAVLGVPELLHASAYALLARRDPSSRSLADLIGQDKARAWHVIEANAREVVTRRGRRAWK
jgi:hypothetical protein